MSAREQRKADLETVQARLGVTFPPAFTEAYVGGADLPNGSPPRLWDRIELLQWPSEEEDDKPPEGVGFPDEGDPDFYCLVQGRDGKLSEVVHLWTHEKAAYEPMLARLGAEPGTTSPEELRKQSPLFAPAPLPDDIQWEAVLVDVLVERELIEFRPINRPYVTRLLGNARPSDRDEAALRKSARAVVELLEDADIVEDFFFDDAELYEILQAIVS
ncbi:MAG: hypothetical protein AAGN82_18590 [Myxococcota bacterium]